MIIYSIKASDSLCARQIEAILRRAKISSEKEIAIGDFLLSEESMSAKWKGVGTEQ